MNSVIFGNPGKIKLFHELLEFMQESYQNMISAFLPPSGSFIIRGCDDAGGGVTNPGYVVINGEMYYFRGGTTTLYVSIVEEVIKKPYVSGVENDLYKKREVAFTTELGIEFANFRRINLLNNLVCTGIIAQWKGSISTIPFGWALCNGENGTPDLRDKFVVGASTDVEVSPGVYTQKTMVTGEATVNGGNNEVTLDKANIPAHIHGFLGSDNDASLAVADLSTGHVVGKQDEFTTDGSEIENNIKASPDPISILPPYYALAYIMKL